MRQTTRSNKRAPSIPLLIGAIAAGLVGFLAAPVRAQDFLGNETIQFSEDTTIEFEFKRTMGANRSTLGVRNIDTGEEAVLFREVTPFDGYVPGQPLTSSPTDFVGTVEAGTVKNGLGQASQFAEFKFKANNRYVFYLDSVSPSGQTTRTFESTNASAAQFNGALDGGSAGDAVGVRVAWDDDGLPSENKDFDNDDFIIEAGGYLVTVTCPPVR
ncbi:MAG: hypothetical protein LDL41_04845 [Coleofasciculus sp. S288]|nr:hypothetical protein [Coleofasciculus sp. S288]